MEPVPRMIYNQAAGLVKVGILKTEDEFKQCLAYANRSPLTSASSASDKETVVPVTLARALLLFLKALVLKIKSIKLIASFGKPARDFVQDFSELTSVLCTHVVFHPEAMILLHRYIEEHREKGKQRWTNKLTHIGKNVASDEMIAVSEDDKPILSSLSPEALKLVFPAACSSWNICCSHVVTEEGRRHMSEHNRRGVGSIKMCIKHGGGRRCEHPEGCNNTAQSGSCKECIEHGGGRRCEHPESCNKAAQSGSFKRCIEHGGGPTCEHPEGPTVNDTCVLCLLTKIDFGG